VTSDIICPTFLLFIFQEIKIPNYSGRKDPNMSTPQLTKSHDDSAVPDARRAQRYSSFNNGIVCQPFLNGHFQESNWHPRLGLVLPLTVKAPSLISDPNSSFSTLLTSEGKDEGIIFLLKSARGCPSALCPFFLSLDIRIGTNCMNFFVITEQIKIGCRTPQVFDHVKFFDSMTELLSFFRIRYPSNLRFETLKNAGTGFNAPIFH
jgi:hypothetical protein